jgi:hypothetical protein
MAETYYAPLRGVRCADGVIRVVHVKRYSYDGSFAADSYFSVPARAHVKGHTITGYISENENFGCDGDTVVYEFRAYANGKNANVIVPIASAQ